MQPCVRRRRVLTRYSFFSVELASARAMPARDMTRASEANSETGTTVLPTGKREGDADARRDTSERGEQ